MRIIRPEDVGEEQVQVQPFKILVRQKDGSWRAMIYDPNSMLDPNDPLQCTGSGTASQAGGNQATAYFTAEHYVLGQLYSNGSYIIGVKGTDKRGHHEDHGDWWTQTRVKP
eukprot:s4893_g2.t1